MNQKYQVNMILNSLKSSIRAIVCILLVEIPLVSFPQGIKIKEMKQVISDLSASTHQRMDSSGTPCGLVKVLMSSQDLSFGDNVVGSIDNKMNEYWVYLPNGTKELTIKRQNYLPMIVQFKEYGIEKIESKMTYQLLLKEVSFNTEKTGVVINVNPKTAQLKIDNIVIDNREDGSYKLFLEKGEHTIRIEAPGYRTKVNVVKSGKGTQTLEVDLESLMAKVKIDCETSTVDIFINDKKYGVGYWEGNLITGDYILEVRKEGYKTQSRSISLAEKDVQDFHFPQLEREMVPIIIKTTPSVCFLRNVYIDGSVIGRDSIVKQIIPAGKHLLKIEINGRKTIEDRIDVNSTIDTLIYNLEPADDVYDSAYRGDFLSCCRLGRKFDHDTLQAKFWYDNALKPLMSLEASSLLDYDYKREVGSLIRFYGNYKDSSAIAHISNYIEESIDKIQDNDDEFNQIILKKMDLSLGLAGAYYNMGNFREALFWFEKSLPGAKKCTIYDYSNAYTVYNSMHYCYKELGDLDGALDCLFKGLKAYPNDYYSEERGFATMYLYIEENIGDVYYEKGNLSEAIKWYRKYYKGHGWDKEHNSGNKVEFVRDLKRKGIYEKVVNP